MEYFFWGSLILFILTVIFYLVFFYLVNYWKEHKYTPAVVPLLYTFDFFLIGFLILAIGSLLLEYFPTAKGLLI